jgi:hypothetical protein
MLRDDETAPAPPGYRSEAEEAKYLNKDVRTLQRWRRQRVGPPYTNIGKTILYRESSTDTWLLAQEHAPVREQTRKRRRRTAEAQVEA